MRRLLPPLILSLCSLQAVGQLAAPRPRLAATTTAGSCVVYHSVMFTWAYTPNLAACAPNSTLQSCYAGFTGMDITSNVTIATPSTLGPAATTYTYTPAGGLFTGTHQFQLVANGYDASGNPITSSPAVVAVTNSAACLNPPAGLTAVLQ